MTRPTRQPDDWLSRQMREVPLPDGLLGRLESISQEPGAELTDEELDTRLRDVPLPVGLIASLERISEHVPPRIRWGSVAAAAALAMVVSLSYAGAMLGVAMAAFETRVFDEAWEAQLRVDFLDTAPEPSDEGMFSDPSGWQFVESPVIQINGLEDLPEPVSNQGSVGSQLATSPVLGSPEAAPIHGPLVQVARGEFLSNPLVELRPALLGGLPAEWVLGAAVDRGDLLGELWRVTREAPRGMAPPLESGWDQLFQLRHGVHPVVGLGHWNRAKLRFCQVPLVTNTDSYDLARRYLRHGRMPAADEIRVEDFLAAVDYGFGVPRDENLGLELAGGKSVFGEPQLPNLLAIGVRARSAVDRVRPNTRLTILVDRSGSMQRSGRMEMVRRALDELSGWLKPGDRLTLVAFDEEAEVLIPELAVERGRSGHRKTVRDALAGLEPRHSTNLLAGLQAAYEVAAGFPRDDSRRHRVVLLTDAMSSLNAPVLERLEQGLSVAAQEGLTLSAVDLGDRPAADPLLARLVQAGDGRMWSAGSSDTVLWSLVEALTGWSQLVAEASSVQVEFNPRAVELYRLIGHEASDANLQGAGSEVDLRSGQVATSLFELRLYPVEPDTPVAAVTLNWHDPFTGESHRLTETVLRRQFDDLPSGLARAAVVAETAELLRESYFAGEGSRQRLLELAGQLASDVTSAQGDRGFEQFVKFLRELDEQAGTASRRPRPQI